MSLNRQLSVCIILCLISFSVDCNDSSMANLVINIEEYREAFLQLHNNARAQFNLQPLQRDQGLEDFSYAWVNSCRIQGYLRHSNVSIFGENIAWFTGDWKWYSNYEMANAMFQVWYDEKNYFINHEYPYITTNPEEDVGHYSQIMWANTTHIGCTINFITNTSYYLVCNYYPAGNIYGEKTF